MVILFNSMPHTNSNLVCNRKFAVDAIFNKKTTGLMKVTISHAELFGVLKIAKYIIILDVQRPLINDLWVFLFQKIDAECVYEPVGLEHLCLSKLFK